MRSLFKFIARITFFGASLAFVVGVTMFLIGSFFITWPLHRISPRTRKMRAVMDATSSVMAMLYIIQEGEPPDAQGQAPDAP